MRLVWKSRIVLLAALIGVMAASLGHAIQPRTANGSPIEYRISLREPEKHFFHVEIRIPRAAAEVIIRMPAWNGLYQVRDFAQYIVGLHATDDAGGPLPVRKMDKQTWRVTSTGLPVTVRYDIYWDQPDAYSSQLNSQHAFLNLATVLCYVGNSREWQATLEFTEVPKGWRVATALPWEETTRRYVAPNYDELADAPVEISDFQEAAIEVGSARYRIVIHGDRASFQISQLRETIEQIVGYQTKLMGGAPFDEFVFLYHFLPGSGGGMEHKNSTAIFLRPNELQNDLRSFASVTAHEFFHLWNVKRIRPQSLEPVEYTEEQYTRALWFAEGVTSSYAALTLVRTGLYSRERFYAELGREIEFLESRPARLWKSAEEASLDAWLEKYLHYSQPEFSISYYNKGELLGILLDLGIRHATGNRRSLDDVMRRLYQQYGAQGKLYDDQRDILAACEEVAGTGFGEFFNRYVAGTEELPYQTYLGYAGLALRRDKREVAWLGFETHRRAGRHYVVNLVPDSAAAKAGVRTGDELVAIEGKSVPWQIEQAVRSRRPGERVLLTVRREEAQYAIRYRLPTRQVETYNIAEKPEASVLEQRIREGLLEGMTEP